MIDIISNGYLLILVLAMAGVVTSLVNTDVDNRSSTAKTPFLLAFFFFGLSLVLNFLICHKSLREVLLLTSKLTFSGYWGCNAYFGYVLFFYGLSELLRNRT
jgi:drug/metabolite transporter (DMT)-like permease